MRSKENIALITESLRRNADDPSDRHAEIKCTVYREIGRSGSSKATLYPQRIQVISLLGRVHVGGMSGVGWEWRCMCRMRKATREVRGNRGCHARASGHPVIRAGGDQGRRGASRHRPAITGSSACADDDSGWAWRKRRFPGTAWHEAQARNDARQIRDLQTPSLRRSRVSRTAIAREDGRKHPYARAAPGTRRG